MRISFGEIIMIVILNTVIITGIQTLRQSHPIEKFSATVTEGIPESKRTERGGNIVLSWR